MTSNYKEYSLENLENWMHDAMSSAEATPQEIYDVIVGVVKDNYYTYKAQTENASELLALLNGNGKMHLSYDKNDPSPECKGAWNDFWEENYYPEEHSQYTDEEIDAMSAAAEEEELISKEYFKENGFWKKSKDKVKKWILPVEEVDCDECIINLPDDLLEAANLKEGDEVEWVDNGDGSYLMKKVTKKGN